MSYTHDTHTHKLHMCTIFLSSPFFAVIGQIRRLTDNTQCALCEESVMCRGYVAEVCSHGVNGEKKKKKTIV